MRLRSDWRQRALAVPSVVPGFPILTSPRLTQGPAANGIVVATLLPAATTMMAMLRDG
ncbi:hypothetical protein [Paracraurococcus ruber]|uniref:hypothetical protein n=1 Tax=Paracraurococcus ruber TaxID=77675 RepID=UPI0013052C08|nr:hypothetical protein [Paracraurococcus ruber]